MSGFLPHSPLSDCVKVNRLLFIRMSILEEIGIVAKKIPIIEIYRTCNISEVDRVLLLGRLLYQQFAFLLGGTLTAQKISENLCFYEALLLKKKMENLHPTGCQCLTCCPPQPQTTQEDLNQDLDYFLTYSNPPHHQNIPTTEYYQPPDNLGLHYPYINPYPDYQFNQLPENPANLPLPNQSLMNLGGTETYTYTNMSTPVSTPYNPPQDQPSTSSGITDGGRRSKKTCAHCSKVFAHTGDYRKHMRKHTKEKPYQCTRCGKYFAHTSNLHRHVRSHEGVRPHKCELCGKEFGRKDKLDSHKKCSKSCRDKKPDRQ